MSNNTALAEAQPKERSLSTQLQERGFNPQQWRVLKDALFPEASNAAVLMAIDYCKARGLDIMKKPVHIVPVWDSNINGYRETVWPSITELRTTAMRTGQYAGKSRVEFGPDITERVGSIEITYPEWAQVTVYRLIGGHRVAFEGDPVYWREAYARTSKRDATPNGMWTKRPRGQLAKNAEAAALRMAFPEEIGNDYTAEEMEGQILAANVDAFMDDQEATAGTTEATRDITAAIRARQQKAAGVSDAEFKDTAEPTEKPAAKDPEQMTLSDLVNKIAECQTPDTIDDLLDLGHTILKTKEDKDVLSHAAAARARFLEEGEQGAAGAFE